MWLFLEQGFFSVVLAHAQDKGKRPAKRDPNRVMVRARVREHIDAFLEDLWPDDKLPRPEVLESPHRDYRFRLIVPKDVFATILFEATMSMSAANFKNSVAARWGHDDPYTDLCHRVWGQHYGMQKQATGPGIYG